MIVLYGSPLSTYTAKVRLALNWRGLAFEERDPEGGYRSTAWSELVAMGTIPALDHDGFFLSESEAILEYLEDAFPGRPLLPAQPQARAVVRCLARLHDLHVEPQVRALFALIKDPTPGSHLPHLKASLEDRLERLARVAVASPCMAGDQPSLADCGFAVTLPLARRLLLELGQPLVMPAKLWVWEEAMAADRTLETTLVPWRAALEAWLLAFRRPK